MIPACCWHVPLLTAIFLTLALMKHVKTQMMPDYGDYPDYRSRDEQPMPDDPYGMDDPSMSMSRRMRGMDRDRGMGRPGEPRKNEVIIGSKRFKLYEKKRLNFERAKKFCKKKDGKLAEANTIEEMRRLESLFMKARMLGMDVWVGADKKKWKKHSWKHVGHPGLNLNNSEMEKAGIKAMMMGAGQKEHCPAISLSTRNIAPVQCIMPLPFICEYQKDRPRTTTKKPRTTTKKPKLERSTTKPSKKKKGKVKGKSKKKAKDEMKR